MKAKETRALDFINNAPQFIIPIYQRNYSWTSQQCRQLWNDILRAGKDESITGHFIGSIVYIEEGLSNLSLKSPVLVIDGQQRLTTITLLLKALAERLDDQEPIEGFSKEKIYHYYLLNSLEKGDRRYKLLLSQSDKSSLLSILGAPETPQEFSLTITENFKLFNDLLKDCSDITLVCKGLAKLFLVDIALNRDHDNPQLIFESMNSTGLALSQVDLIRNYLLMELDIEQQKNIYERYWRPMEIDFGQSAYLVHFDKFMRHYLTIKMKEIPRFDKIYIEFKKYAQRKTNNNDVEVLVADLRSYAQYYCNMVLGNEQDKELRQAFLDIKELKIEVAYPFLLELYHDYINGILSKADFLIAVRLVESYVFRRSACAIPTNSLNKTFATFSQSIDKECYLESIQASFVLLSSYRRFPDDNEFEREVQVRNLYANRLRHYWLRKIENFGRKELVSVEEYTIEHILPQNKNLSAKWRKELGEDWKRIQEQWLHTLGNLTLTGYNSEFGDRSFEEKRDMVGGFKESPLRLNEGLGKQSVWNEEAIKERAYKLAKKALDIWFYPELETDSIEKYKKFCFSTASEYTLNDYAHLKTPKTKELFELLRSEILALDPIVSEEILKQYIAYKAETNFVDVTPQSNELRLFLNMKFHEIIDPKGGCRDVTSIGHWGNGNVEVFFSNQEELPYIMGLIRQSFEMQLGEN